MNIPKNFVKLAVRKAGGPTKVSNLLSVSNGTVHNWMKQGRVSDIDKARALAKESGYSVEEVRP